MQTDFVIIGSGIAGLALALKLSEVGEVVIITKKDISAGSTGLAQGGIAGVRNTSKDTFKEHFEDTMRAGAYLNDKQAVKYLVKNAPKALETLEKFGVKFDFSLHREGGHSRPRISHVADETGRAVQEILTEQIWKNKKIKVLENHFAIDLINQGKIVYGVCVFDDKKVVNVFAKKVVISTGGAGQIYKKTTNPSVATGDGMAMAIHAGVEIKDLEFVQFHPTAFDYPRDPLFLLSEALRGEGANLINEKEEKFIDELAPRDIVARAIFKQKKTFLDFRHEKESILAKKFPNIFENLLTAGYNLSNDLIPVTPAAHFFCGGIKTDVKGRTNLKNLSALGEVACTGVHGANRLASNSLLEAVVFAEAIFQDFKQNSSFSVLKECKKTKFKFYFESKKDLKIRNIIQNTMWQNVGLIRTKNNLKEARKTLSLLKPIGTETKNLLTIAQAVVNASIKRKQSIGCHYLE